MSLFGNLIQPFFEGGGGSVIEAPVEFRAEATYLQWRLTEGEDTEWKNLKTWASLTGADGEDGADGAEVSLQKTETHIQWKLGDGEWANLVALADITGPTGTAGADGEDGLGVPEGGTTGQVLKKRSNSNNDTEWANESGGDGADVGDICFTYRQTAKTGWLLLDGSEVLKATYADLYGVIGDIGGEASDSDHFVLPDHRERVPVVKKAGGTFATIGATGGAETEEPTVLKTASHTHTYIPGAQGPNITQLMYEPGSIQIDVMTGLDPAGVTDTGATGGDTELNILQPYIVISTAQIKY